MVHPVKVHGDIKVNCSYSNNIVQRSGPVIHCDENFKPALMFDPKFVFLLVQDCIAPTILFIGIGYHPSYKIGRNQKKSDGTVVRCH